MDLSEAPMMLKQDLTLLPPSPRQVSLPRAAKLSGGNSVPCKTGDREKCELRSTGLYEESLMTAGWPAQGAQPGLWEARGRGEAQTSTSTPTGKGGMVLGPNVYSFSHKLISISRFLGGEEILVQNMAVRKKITPRIWADKAEYMNIFLWKPHQCNW